MVSGRMSPSLQLLHFRAETNVPNSVTSKQREHLHLKNHSSSMLIFLLGTPRMGGT